MTAERWVLARRPTGLPVLADFRLERVDLPALGPGQIRVAVSHFSVDPGMRARLSADSYAPVLKLGEVIEGAGIGHVAQSRNPRFPEGAPVTGGFGWQTGFVSDGRGVALLDRDLFGGTIPATAAIGVLGVPGLTAYFGLIEIAKAQAGETVLVSSAAGPVGATAVQVAKALGLKTVGLAGSPAKCDYVRAIGADVAINYRSDDLAVAFVGAAPEGFDIYFDNVGGEMLDRAIASLRERGRIVVSGQVSEYNRTEPRGIRNVTSFITRSLTMTGFVVYAFRAQFRAAQEQMATWIGQGQLSFREEIIPGIGAAPSAFLGLFSGESFGRRLIAV